MKIDEVPQDLKHFEGTAIRDINYALDDDGRYQAVMSDGWDAKSTALDITLDDIHTHCEEIKAKVKAGHTSALEYHLAANLMTVELLSSYTGIPKRKIRKHLAPKEFDKLDASTLGKYADAMRITVEELTRQL